MTCVCACERPAVEDGEVLSPCPCSLSVPCVNSIANIAHSVHAATHPNEDGEIDEHSQGYSTSDDVPVVQPDSALHLSHCNRHAIDTHCATYRSWHLSRIPRPSQLPSALLNLDAGAGTGTGTGAGTGTGTDIDGHVVEIPHISEHNIDNDHDDSKNDMRDLDMFPSRPSHSLRAVDHHVDCLALKNSQTPRSPVHSQTTKENNTTLKTHCSPPTYQPVVIDLVSDQSSSSGSHNYADGEISDGSAHEDSDHHSLSEDSSHSLRTPPHSDTQQHSLSLPEYALPTSTILYPTSRDILPDSSHPVTVPWQSPIIPQPPLIPPFSKCVNFDQQTRALPSVSASLVSFPAPASMAFGVSIPSFDSPPSHHARSNIYSPSAASIRVFNPIFSKDNCTNICQHGQSACPTCLPSETRQCRDGQDSKQDNNRYCHHDANETSSSSAASVEESPRKRLRVSSPLLLDQNPSCNPLTFVMPSEQMSDPSRLSADARDNDVPASVYGGSQSKPCPAGSRPSVPQSAGTLHNTEQPSKRQLDLKAMKEAALKSSLLRKSRLSTLDKPLPTSEESIDKILFLYDDEDSSVCESEDNSRVSSAKSGCEGNCIARSLDDTHAVSRSSLPGAIDSPSTDCMSSVLQKRLELERLRRQILEREEERRIQAVQQGAPLPVLRRSLGSSAGTRQSLPRVDDARKSGSAARSAQADISQERDELLRRISELEEAKLSARRQGKRQKKSAGGALDSAKENNIACINDYDDARHSTTDSSAEDVPQDVKRIEEGEHPKHSGRSASQQMREVIDENVGAVHGEKCAADAQNTKSSKRRRLAVSKLPRFCDVPQTETSKDDRDVSSTAANKNSSGVTVLVDVLSSREHGLCLNADDQTESKSLNFHHDHKPSEKGSSAPWNESENIRDNFSSSPKGTAYRDQLARSDILVGCVFDFCWRSRASPRDSIFVCFASRFFAPDSMRRTQELVSMPELRSLFCTLPAFCVP